MITDQLKSIAIKLETFDDLLNALINNHLQEIGASLCKKVVDNDDVDDERITEFLGVDGSRNNNDTDGDVCGACL